ncbi:MAG: hypothetical protein KC488_07625 [Candidatus Cloacimonetes bacterium]|nr:hypothetical protein [Candidatus Cloacimonadota bacterium]
MKRALCILGLGLAIAAAASADSTRKLFSNMVVKADETVDTDLTVMRGDLVVEGTVIGNVVVMFGNCELKPGARIEGDLVVLHGGLDLVSKDQVSGRISQRDLLKAMGQAEDSNPFTVDDLDNEPHIRIGSDIEVSAGPMIQYDSDGGEDLRLLFNRVAGLQLGMTFNPSMQNLRENDFDLSGHAEWAFGTKRPEYQLELRKALLQSPLVYAHIGSQRFTDTQDGWMLGSVENSVAGWLLKQDYRDYYDNKGVSLGLGLHLESRARATHDWSRTLHLRAGWFSETWQDAQVNSQWNWSRVDRPYRPNLYLGADSPDLFTAVNANGDTLSYPFYRTTANGLRLGMELGTLRKGGRRMGATLALNLEQSLGGEFEADSVLDLDYRRIMGSFKAWLPFGKRNRESLNFRLLAGENGGSNYPLQYGFRLGGPDALPGYRPKGLDAKQTSWKDRMNPDPGAGARRMVLGSLEYQLAGEAVRVPIIEDIMEDFSYLLMVDAGHVFDEGWDTLEAGSFQANVGVGIGGEDDDDWRLAAFRSTESGQADWRLLFRFNRRF